MQAYLLYRKQWVNIPGAPESQVLSLDGRLAGTRFGLGVMFYNDINNIIGKTGGLMSGSYQVKLADHHSLNFGMALGVVQNKIFFDRIRAQDQHEQSIFANMENKTSIDGNIGISYAYKRLEAGVASSQIFHNAFRYTNAADGREANYRLVRHYTASIKYNYATDNNKFKVEPTLLLNSAQGQPAVFDLSATFRYKDFAWLNTGYRIGYGVFLGTGFVISENISFGYSYDFSTTQKTGMFGSSHEFILGYKFRNRDSSRDKSDLVQYQSMYEQLDALKQENEQLTQQVEENTESLSRKIEELEQLKSSVEKDKELLMEMIRTSKVNIDDLEERDSNSDYYIVVGAFRVLSHAKALQKIMIRQLDLQTSIVSKSNNSWFLVYTRKVHTRKEAQAELKTLNRKKVSVLIQGNAWIYKPEKQ